MLDYSVPQFEFLVGDFDASNYLDSISLSLPMHEPGQALLWSGSFKVSNNLAAKIAGLTDTDFSESDTPNRWRPYQKKVYLNIRGHQSPALRIQNYRYNPQTSTGEGTLTQIPTAVAGERTSSLLATAIKGGFYIGAVIYKLLADAFSATSGTITQFVDSWPKYPPIWIVYNFSQTPPVVDLDLDFERLYAPTFSRNPLGEALKLLALNWTWLIVDKDEKIRNIDGSKGSIAFSRSLDRVELVPDLAAIYSEATHVVVSGSRQIVDTSATDNIRKPKFKTTNEKRPEGTVFPQLAPSDTPIVFEQKTIIYQYGDDASWSQYIPSGSIGLTGFAAEIDGNKGTKPTDDTTPWQTITIKRQPRGYLFPSLGVDQTLVDAEVLVESNIRRLVLKPAGVLFPSLGADVTLAIEKNERLTSTEIPPGSQLVPRQVSADGTVQKYQLRPTIEQLQPAATVPLETETFAVLAQIQPLDWTPIFTKLLIVDFGFVPSYNRASFLAQKLAIREQQRRDQVLVDMPIPDEWLAANWPPLARCQIGDDIWLMDGIAIAITDREAKFGFTGALVSKGKTIIVDGVPTIVQQTQYQIVQELAASLVFDIEIESFAATGLEPSIVFEMILQSGVRVDIESNVVFDGSISSAGGTMLVPEMVFESIVSTGAGIALDAGIILDAIVTTQVLQRLTFTVSPSSQLEGSPVVQTLTFTVSPSSQLEG